MIVGDGALTYNAPPHTRWEFGQAPSIMGYYVRATRIETDYDDGVITFQQMYYTQTLVPVDCLPPLHFFYWLHTQAAQMQMELNYHIQQHREQEKANTHHDH